jgi:hypothetical protein
VGAKPWVATVAAGTLLLTVPAIGFGILELAAPIPAEPAPSFAILYPIPLLVAIPSILFGGAWGHSAAYLAAFVPALLFWAWSVHLFRGEPNPPLRSVLLFWTLAALTFVYFIGSWDFGVRWQGYVHLLAVAVLNVVALYVLSRLLRTAKSTPLFRHNLIFHWALFAWLAWLAFPWLGEGL